MCKAGWAELPGEAVAGQPRCLRREESCRWKVVVKGCSDCLVESRGPGQEHSREAEEMVPGRLSVTHQISPHAFSPVLNSLGANPDPCDGVLSSSHSPGRTRTLTPSLPELSHHSSAHRGIEALSMCFCSQEKSKLHFPSSTPLLPEWPALLMSLLCKSL